MPVHSGSPAPCESYGLIGLHRPGCIGSRTAQLLEGTSIEDIIRMPKAAKYAIRQRGLHELANLATIQTETDQDQVWIHWEDKDGKPHTTNVSMEMNERPQNQMVTLKKAMSMSRTQKVAAAASSSSSGQDPPANKKDLLLASAKKQSLAN
jgi:hypothetical protein